MSFHYSKSGFKKNQTCDLIVENPPRSMKTSKLSLYGANYDFLNSKTVVKEIRFGPNFSIKGAPGPYLGFGKDGKYVKATQFSKLLKTTGAQTYKVPASIDVSEFNEFYVWCKPFNVPLALAKLTK